jgi:hypothetical protein
VAWEEYVGGSLGHHWPMRSHAEQEMCLKQEKGVTFPKEERTNPGNYRLVNNITA